MSSMYVKIGNEKYEAMLKSGECSGVFDNALGGDSIAIDEIELHIRWGQCEFEYERDANGEILYDAGGEQCFVLEDEIPEISPLDYPWGTSVFWYRSDNTLLGKFYLYSSARENQYWYVITARSALQLLEGITHAGGVYDGQTADEIADDIFGSIAHTIDPIFAGIPVYGYLPFSASGDGGSKQNLWRLLFAVGGCIKKNPAGDIHIGYLTDASPLTIPQTRLAVKGSVANPEGYTGVELTEYSIIADTSADSDMLYSGQASAAILTCPSGIIRTGVLVTFNKPVIISSLSATGTMILESGVNYAVISGSPECTLTGVPYTQSTRALTQIESIPGKKNIKSISGFTLVSMVNSVKVLQRCVSNYVYGHIVQGQMILNNERPSDYTAFTNAFGESAEGYIKKLKIIAGAEKLIADYEILCGYNPPAPGNLYKCCQIITASGNKIIPWVCDTTGALSAGTYLFSINGSSYYFTLTASAGTGPLRLVYGGGNTLDIYDILAASWLSTIDVTAGSKIGTMLPFTKLEIFRAVIIGGGDGGAGGYDGASGYGGAFTSSQTPGDFTADMNSHTIYYSNGKPTGGTGGNPGTPGKGGKIYIVDVNCESGTELVVDIGSGGYGGDHNNGSGQPGENTTFTVNGEVYKSSDGNNTNLGFREILSENLYATDGDNGISGAAGGYTTLSNNFGWNADSGASGSSCNNFSGGTGGNGYSSSDFVGGGGGGGGAAYGANGNNGGSPGIRISESGISYAHGGRGGSGANALAPTTPSIYGKGGTGGNGGGGGGNDGGCRVINYNPLLMDTVSNTRPSGGKGSAGGNGAPGAILIYF